MNPIRAILTDQLLYEFIELIAIIIVGMEQVNQHVQLYTPVMLNRPPGGCYEPDPLYFRNTSTMETGLCKQHSAARASGYSREEGGGGGWGVTVCASASFKTPAHFVGADDPKHGCGAACWNILNHLDFGVLSGISQPAFEVHFRLHSMFDVALTPDDYVDIADEILHSARA